MSLRPQRLRELAQDLDQSLGALGLEAEQRAHDGWFDPAALTAALADEASPVLLRVHPHLLEAEEGYAPTPRLPAWLRLDDDGAEVAVQGQREAQTLQVASVSLEAGEERWPGYLKGKPKWVATLTLEASERWRVAEAVGDDERAARAQLATMGRALADRLGVDGPDASEAGEHPQAPRSPPTARELAPWTFRREGELWVLRDYASHGPRESAGREWAALAIMFLGAIGCWVMTARSYGLAAWEPAAIWGTSAFVLSLSSFATFHIARHSSRYRERSEAIMFMAAGSFVVSPWLSRAGAVDDKPEGSYGAAIRLRELERASVAPIGGHTIRLYTTHGPMDVGTLETEAMADRWRAVLLRFAGAVGQGKVPAAASLAAALVLLVTLVGCAPAVEPAPPPVATAAAVATSAPAAVASTTSSVHPAVEPAPPAPELSLVEDDFAGAKAKAAADGRLVFVEVWAPWCHTCLSMKGFVLPDPAVTSLRDRVVFATIDSDRPENEAFMDRYAVNMWPTLFVIDPDDERVLGMWPGSASVEELRKFIVDAVDAGKAAGDPQSPEAALVAAKAAQAAGKYAQATNHYELALRRGGADWSRRSEALHGLTFSTYRAGRFARCAELGAKHAEEIEGAAVPTDFSYVVLTCAGRVTVPAVRNRARAAALKRLERHVASFPASASVDDRADALGLLAGEVGKKDPKRREALLGRQLQLLEAAAAAAPGPQEASTFDYTRMNAYLALGRGEKAVALLSKRMVELPDNYEPAARLAQVFIALRMHERAREPLARAVKQSYGPRQLRYLEQSIDLELTLKDPESIEAAREAFLAAFERVPTERRKSFAERARRVRAALDRK